jgi:hypothetical protein
MLKTKNKKKTVTLYLDSKLWDIFRQFAPIENKTNKKKCYSSEVSNAIRNHIVSVCNSVTTVTPDTIVEKYEQISAALYDWELQSGCRR